MGSNLDNFFSESQTVFFPKKIKRIKTLPSLGKHLLEYDQRMAFTYRAAMTHLLAFMESNCPTGDANAIFIEKYLHKRKQLASKVLTVGSQLYATYDKLTDQPLDKRQLAKELYFCELLIGVEKSKWQKHYLDNEQRIFFSVRNLIRNTTAGTNWYRLYAIRLKRVFVALMPLIKSILYQKLINGLNALNPALSYIAWMFYVPRALANIITLIQHTIAGPWMTEEESQIDYLDRLKTHWSRLWFEVLNDTVWCFVGLMCCFVLDASSGMLLTVALYFFDVAMAMVRAHKNINHHLEMEHELNLKLTTLEKLLAEILQKGNSKKTDILIEEINLIKEHKGHTDEWIFYEQQKLMLSIQITSALAVAMTIGAMPTLFALGATISIFLPIVSAASVVMICSWQYYESNQIEKTCPSTDILNLKNIEEQLALDYGSDEENEVNTSQRHNDVHLVKSKSTGSLVSMTRSQANDVELDTLHRYRHKHNLSCPEELWSLVCHTP